MNIAPSSGRPRGGLLTEAEELLFDLAEAEAEE